MFEQLFQHLYTNLNINGCHLDSTINIPTKIRIALNVSHLFERVIYISLHMLSMQSDPT